MTTCVWVTLLIVMIAYLSFQETYLDWQNILVHRIEGCECRLAIDINGNCVGAKVVLKPHNPNKPSQQWRWVGNMLVNKQNGYAITANGANQLILSHPGHAPNQKFARYLPEDDYNHRIYLQPLIKGVQHFIDTERKHGDFENVPLVVNPRNNWTVHQFYHFRPAGGAVAGGGEGEEWYGRPY